MNTASAFLAQNRDHPELVRYGPAENLSSMLYTPRFRASAHVIFLILAEGSSDPVLVVKASRLPGPSATLESEAANLRAIHAAVPGGLASVPRLLAYEEYAGTPLLLETALRGRPLGSRLVRRNPVRCADAVAAWVSTIGSATAQGKDAPGADFERLVSGPLSVLEQICSCPEDAELLAQAYELTAPLLDHSFPLVFTHGDLAAPNLLLSENDTLEVVDWELAEAEGLPGEDLFFALAYLAFARQRAARVADYCRAFQQAFFESDGWARTYWRRYAVALQLPHELMKPLFVACWSRYLARLVHRLTDSGTELDRASQTAVWLRQNRFFTLWRHTVRHAAYLDGA